MGNSSCTKLEPETHNAISSKKWQLMILLPFWLMNLFTTEIIFWRLAKLFLDLCYFCNIKIIDNISKRQTGSFLRNHWSIISASYWFCRFGFRSREQDIKTLHWFVKNAQLSVTWLEDEVVTQLLLFEKEQICGVMILGGGKANRE